MRMQLKRTVATVGMLTMLWPGACLGWGNEGHKIVALTAAKILATDSPSTLAKIQAMLAKDRDDIWPGADVAVDHDIGGEATWADLLREKSPKGKQVTESWHFVDIDMTHPDVDTPCNNHPKVPAGELASLAPSPDCVIDKIDQFTVELKDAQTSDAERLLALKFLLHFVGDLHQPLHAATRTDPQIGHEDFGGNCVGILHGHATEPTRLHSYWDTDLVEQALGTKPDVAAAKLASMISANAKKRWSSGTPSDWAKEAHGHAKTSVYAGVVDKPPVQTDFVFTGFDGNPDNRCGPSKVFRTDANYDKRGAKVVTLQLGRAAARLAWLLKQNLK
jgi:hypothetical protein